MSDAMFALIQHYFSELAFLVNFNRFYVVYVLYYHHIWPAVQYF